jgi:hypothetical protein
MPGRFDRPPTRPGEPRHHEVGQASVAAPEWVPFRELERRDGQLQRLQQMEDLARFAAGRNATAISERRFNDLLALPFDFLLEKYRRYPIEVTRQGQIISRDLTKFGFLPHRADLRLVNLGRGDLDAAAEWGMLPALPVQPEQIEGMRPFHRREGAHQALATVARLESTAIISNINLLQHQRIHNLYDANTHGRLPDSVSPPQVGDLTEREMTAELRTLVAESHLEGYNERPEQLAERVAFTLLARMGARMAPAFEVFRSDVGEDVLANVDLLARTHDLIGARSWFTGIDITTAMDQRVVVRKQTRLDQQPSPFDLADPETGRSLLARKALVNLRGFDWQHMLKAWEQRRGNTAITPEYFLRFDHRRELAAMAISRLKQLSGEPLYSYESIRKVYESVYGKFDPPGQPFPMPHDTHQP